ncbi:MAG: DUF4912 domain-containing protein [Treponema sp.]|jgi:hypothetical protein|nr:DUF4912 domain-containing protein [Treponema sp.]
MKSTELSRTYLESLTTEELIVLADRFDIEIPPDLAWNFIVEALLEIKPVRRMDASDDRARMGRGAQQEKAKDDTADYAVPLPEQYNISFIHVLIRDPLWVFVFWEISSRAKELFEYKNEFKPKSDYNRYYLKISPMEDSQKAFIIRIRPTDASWYVGIPEAGRSYKAEVCLLANKKEIVIASSDVFTMPVLFEPVKRYTGGQIGAFGSYDNDFNPLQALSGVNDFTILRKRERIGQ